MLADLAVAHGDGTLRTTQEQDLQLRGIADEKLQDTRAALRSMDERFLSPESIRCVVCAGASTCKLGLCLSRGLAEALDAELRGIKLPKEAVLRISGCPNSCGHHPIAALGLHGTASRVNGRLVPFYMVWPAGTSKKGIRPSRNPSESAREGCPGVAEEFWTAAAIEFKENEAARVYGSLRYGQTA